MQVAQVVERLHKLADARAVAIWAKMYLSPEPYIGVNLTKLKVLAKELKKNHALALELWESGIHDAKLLATMIEEPKKVGAEQIERQMTQIYSCDLVDKYCTNVVAKTPFILPNIIAWTQHPAEMYQRGGYTLLATLARSETLTEDAFFTPYLQRIEAEIGAERNWVREAMNYALIAIGQRTAALHHTATAVAQRVGPIQIDYGDTSCKAPDALASLRAPRVIEQWAA